MESLDQLLEECERLHGHMCAGQLLGARMAMLGCQLVGLNDPRGADRKKLIVWVEIDRCMADAIRAAFSFGNAAPIYRSGDDGCRYGRTSFYGPTGAQSAAGDCTAVVVHQPVPRLARPAPLPGIHQIVRSA